MPGPVAVNRFGNHRSPLDPHARVAQVIAASCLMLTVSCSGGAATELSTRGTAILSRNASVAPAAATQSPADPVVAATAAQVIVYLVDGDLSLACARSLCTTRLAAAITEDPEAGAASAPARTSPLALVVDVETVSDDGYIATVDVWVEDEGTDGRLRSYRVTLACQADGSWRAAGVAP